MAAINFRQSSGYVTDGAGQTYCTTADTYPTTRGGYTFGWESGTISADRDRDNTLDPRLAGINFRTNDGTTATFRVDLPSTGSYVVTLALGDATSDQFYQYALLKDGTSTFATIDDTNGTTAQQFDDATGVTRTSAANWVSGNATLTQTFSSTIFRVQIGSPVSQTNSTAFAHVAIVAAGGGSDVTVALTGQAGAFTAGAMTPSTAVQLVGQVGAFTAGIPVPSSSSAVALIGQAATFTPGTLTAAPQIGLVGQTAIFAPGALAPNTDVSLAGQRGTFTPGTIAAVGDVTVALTGIAATFALGTLTPVGGDTGQTGFGGGFGPEHFMPMSATIGRVRESKKKKPAPAVVEPELDRACARR
jgi:hypothetical protein